MKLFDDLLDLLDLFFNEGYIDVYNSVFNGPQFPFWTIVQIVWVVYVLHRSLRLTKPSIRKYMTEFSVGIIMSFAGGELAAYKLHEKTPIAQNPFAPVIFGIVFAIFEVAPFDFIYIIVNRFYYFLGLLQGTNQARFFVYLTRRFEEKDLALIILIVCLDQIAMRGFQSLLHGRQTPMANLNTIFRNVIFCYFFFGVTHKGRFADLIGLYPVEVPALFLCAMMGIFNAFDNFGLKYDDITSNEEEDNEIAQDHKEEIKPKEKTHMLNDETNKRNNKNKRKLKKNFKRH